MINPANVTAVARRELSAYFNSIIAYIFMVVFVLISCGLYMLDFFLSQRADMRSFFSSLPIVLCVFLPAITMRLWAEDRRGNTLELLLTFPMQTHELVIGKFLASLIFFTLTLATSMTIPITLVSLGQPDLGPIGGAYLGSLLSGAFFLALGIFISGLCRDQIVAFISALILCFGLVFVGTDLVSATIDGWISGGGTLLKILFGMLPHYASFARGIIDWRDVLYFVSGTAIFLVLNGFWLEGRSRPKAAAIFSTATAISIGIFLIANWLLSDVALGRIDLTDGKIYTVSETSKKILQELKAPVLVKLYISPQEKMPTQMKLLEQDLVDKLDEIRIAGRGKFDFKVFHMEAVNVEEEPRDDSAKGEGSLASQIRKKGIEPFRVQSIESDQVGVRLVYAAMAVAYKEKPEEVIPQLIPSSLSELEYLLMSKIYRMTLDHTPKVALVAPYEEKSVDPRIAAILTQLGGGQLPEQYRDDAYRYLPAAMEYAGYEVSRIRLSKAEPIPPETDTLVVINPTNLNDRQRYEINRFLYEGGSVFLGIQEHEFDYEPSPRGSVRIEARPQRSEVNPLLKNFGVEVDESILLDKQSEVISIQGGLQMGPFAVSIPIRTPLHILIGQDGMNQKLSITSNLSPILYMWGSAVKLDQEKLKQTGLRADVLLNSSPFSWTVPGRAGVLNQPDLAPPPAEKFTGSLPLAAWIRGQFPNTFQDRKTLPMWPEDIPPASPQGAPPENVDEKLITPAPELAQKPGQLIVVGASTIFRENLIASGGGPLGFFMNSMDAITLSEDLTNIRNKQEVSRVVRPMPPAAKIGWRFFNILLIPMVLSAIGIFRFMLRRQRKASYIRSLFQAPS